MLYRAEVFSIFAGIVLAGAIGGCASVSASEARDNVEGEFTTTYSQRPYNLDRVMEIVTAEAQRCGVEIRTSTIDPPNSVIISDGGVVRIWITSNASQEQRACMTNAIGHVRDRLYGSAITEEN